MPKLLKTIRRDIRRRKNEDMRWNILERLIKKYKVKTIAEIGVKHGHTGYYLLQACQGIKRYFFIDPLISRHFHQAMLCPKGRVKDKRVFIQSLSEEAVNYFADNCLDLVFIDGSHEYEDVRHDIIQWSKKVKQGGIIAGHDYGHERWPGVTQAVDELRPNIKRGGDYTYWFFNEP
jgi:predicted O-methyltransferase YrrM